MCVKKEIFIPMIYLIVFLLSILLFFYGARLTDRWRKYFCYTSGLLVPCLLAALRAENIGTDVLVYMKPLFLLTDSYSGFWDYYKGIHAGWGTEWAYAFLTYAVKRLTGSLPAFHLITQLLISGMVFFSLRIYGKEEKLWMGMSAYYLLFYNQTFNIVRQSMACSCILYAIVLLKGKKYIQSFLFFILATGFHNTAYFVLAFYGLYLLNRFLDERAKKWMYVVVVGTGFICSVFYKEIILFLFGQFSFLPQRYLNIFQREFSFNIPYALLAVFLINLGILCFVQEEEDKQWKSYMIGLQIGAVALIPLGSFIQVLSRLLLYIQYTCILLSTEARIVAVTRKRKGWKGNIKIHTEVWLLLFFITYWWYFYVFCGSGETYPYRFGI